MPSNGLVDFHNRHLANLHKKDISTELRQSLPAEFYTSSDIYQLERRAIFSKRWFLVSHEARYRNIGDYVQYEMAGFNFVVLRSKDGDIVAFHNMCRHRGFPVVQKPSGNARILSCKYHGWAYDLRGKLTKAPRFTPTAVPDFNADDISLFPVHVHVDRNGFVYVNCSAAEKPEISWEQQYGDLDQQDVIQDARIDWSKVDYDFTWTKEGKFNWKIMQENYNECYHCLTAHPDVAKTTALDTYYVVPSESKGYIAHFSEPKASIHDSTSFDAVRLNGRSATHVFPVGHFSPNPGTGFMHTMRSIPTSATTTRQEYDVYKLNTPTANVEAQERMAKLYQKIVGEDFALCEGLQQNLERGVWDSGPLHPFHEEGVWSFQDAVVEALKGHVGLEKERGCEIWPAKRVSGTQPGKDISLCMPLEARHDGSTCGGILSPTVEW